MSEDAPSDGMADEEAGVWARQTAPQSPYTARQVGIGLVIFAVGAVVAYGLPLVL